MYLSEETKRVLESSIGKTVDELARMDMDEEMEFVQSKTGRRPAFAKRVDYRALARGNNAIAQKRLKTMEEVDREIMGWTQDECENRYFRLK